MDSTTRSAPVALPRVRPGFAARVAKRALGFVRALFRFVGTLFTIGLSLLPLSALLVALPAVSPNEAVLTDTIRPAKSWRARTARRVSAALAGVTVLVALFAFAIAVVGSLPLPPGGQLGTLARKVLAFAATDLMPDDRQPADMPAGKTWLSPKDLLDTRKNLAETLDRPNLQQIERDDTRAELARIDAEIEERTPKVAKLRVMQDPQLAPLLAAPIWKLMPTALVEHWPFVLLVVYASDLALLLLIGKVPLAYNLRYLWVRKRDTVLTAVVFTVVVALVIVLLAFVNGMYKLNEGSGIPGNVLVLSEGSTDELFSNLGYSDVSNIEEVVIAAGDRGRKLPRPTGVQKLVPRPDGKGPLLDANRRVIPLPADAPEAERRKAPALASYETYMVMNQPVPTKPGEPARRRFLQVRALKDVHLAAAVHNLDLYPGGDWFNETSAEQKDGRTYLQCVIGEGVASTLGADRGKPSLGVGDTFTFDDGDPQKATYWIVRGVMKTAGTAYGSEIWTGVNNTVVAATGKANKYTTLVLRMAADDAWAESASRGMAAYLQNNYDQVKLKAYSEPDYYRELTKTNEQFLFWIVVLATVMAVGGVFGVMNTMFASVAARIKEVGVLRILGFKRWQILISFMLESPIIAAAGGVLGCCLGLFANFFEASSTLSGGQGGGKSVALKLIVDYQTVAAGLLFTLVMGRLGGLVPALSAMRTEILDSLR